MTYTIEKNVPVPFTSGRGRSRGGLTQVLREMEIGDSVFTLTEKHSANTLSAMTSKLGRQLHRTYTSRTSQEAKGTRIWRIA